MFKRELTLFFLIALAGCSTKNYGRQPELTAFEKSTMTCREIELEQAKVQGFLQHIRQESSFDGRSVLSFLGDLGIGNMMEKDSAVESATQRMAQLNDIRASHGCSYALQPIPIEKQPNQIPKNGSTTTKDQRLNELINTRGISYEEYRRRYEALMREP